MNDATALSDPRSLVKVAPPLDRRMLLTTKQMANFVSDGFLRFDELIPREMCDELLAEVEAGLYDQMLTMGVAFDDVWPDLVAGRIFRMPVVRGIIESLVGPRSRYDHHFVHRIPGPSPEAQGLHQDAEIDPRREAFDIQFSLFPQDTTKEMGGTLFVPGSHFRRVHEYQVSRYQNILGQVQTVCPTGTLVVWHHNIWHAGRANLTPNLRYMFKLRLNPMVRQVRLWNTDDLHDPQITDILTRPKAWHGQATRVEMINRVRFWRFLTGDAAYDIQFYLSRVGNEPTATYVRAD